MGAIIEIPIEDLALENLKGLDLPEKILIDVDKRITDWLAGGGNMNDLYVKRQIQYAIRCSQYNNIKKIQK